MKEEGETTPLAAPVVSLNEARWGKKEEPYNYKPAEALEAALRDNQAKNFEHVVVCYTYTDDKGDFKVGYIQAGKLNGYLGTMGLLERVKMIVGGAD